VAAFAPEPGDTCNSLAAKFPGSSLGEALRPVPRSDGTTDLYIVGDRFHEQFCADVPAAQAARMATTQRPVTLEALTEPSGEWPLWREVPSSFLIAEADRNIPAALQRFFSERADARRTVEITGASHAVAVSRPEATADLILEAASVPSTL
jgi:pimeloyl-ACP methyl ester carboxylesterase